MPDASDRAIVIPDHVLVQRLPNGEAMMLDVESETYFGLNEVGTRMVDILGSNGSFDEAMKVLLGEYEVDQAELRPDMESLVESLQARGLIVVA